MRLDKLIATSTAFSRAQAKGIIRGGKITVDGKTAKSGSLKLADDAVVEYMGVPIKKPEPQFIMFTPGSCTFVVVFIERITVSSSATDARCGISSEMTVPDSPCGSNL